MSIIANAFSEKNNWEVSLLTLDNAPSPFYTLSPKIDHKSLKLYQESKGPIGALINNLGRVRKLRKALKNSKPDIILSFADKTNALTLLAGMDIAPILVSERIHPEKHNIGRFWSKLRKEIYPSAARVVVQVEDVADWVKDNIGIPSTIIPNPIVPEHIFKRKSKRFYKIIASGRLVEQKGFDLLIEAFSKLEDPQGWSLCIFGEGPLAVRLQNQIDSHNLSHNIRLRGRSETMMENLSEADIFILSSRFEGFPNALLEAMGTGLACIAFNCPSGPKDMIDDGKNGILVEDGNVDELSIAMNALIADATLCTRLGKNAEKSVEQYYMENNIQLWEDTLLSVLENGR